jgi:hypothetical protein
MHVEAKEGLFRIIVVLAEGLELNKRQNHYL